MVKIVDNFLNEEDFKRIEGLIFSDKFLWNWVDGVSYHKDNPNFQEDKKHLTYLVHVLYHNPTRISPFWEHFAPIFENIFDNMKVDVLKSLIRIKINCYPQSNVLEENGMHQDRPFEHKGMLIYMNTCDGYTRFESGEKIDSVANRVVFFNPFAKHTSTNTTNESSRVTINFNYF